MVEKTGVWFRCVFGINMPGMMFYFNKEKMNWEQDIFDNPLFFKWIYHPDVYVDQWWTDFINRHPEIAGEILWLKKQLLMISFSEEKLSDQEKREIARNILKQTIDRKKGNKRKRETIVFLRNIAAALFFFLLGGAATYLLLNDRDPELKVPALHDVAVVNRPTLVLPEGKSVDLEEKDSELDYSSNGVVTINNRKVENTRTQADNGKAINQLIIPYGNRSKVTLGDNTVVWLNAGSRLIYPSVFDGAKREVFLFGEAFFEVSKNEEHPFVVKTAKFSVKVLGTKFNVCAYPEDKVMQTVLTEGQISLRRNDADFFDKDIIVSPGQMASFNTEDQEIKLTRVDPSYYVLWKDGLLKFSDEDLSRVIKKLERFYNITFTFDNPLDGGIKISGKLDLKEDREEVLHYVSKVSLVEIVKEKGGRYRIK